MVDDASLGERLRRRRRELGLQVREAAQTIGVSQPTLSDWENGKTKPAEEHLAAIAEFLDLERARVVLLRYGADAPPGPPPDAEAELRAEMAEMRREMAALTAHLRRLASHLPPAPPGSE